MTAVDSWVTACSLDFLPGEDPSDRLCRFVRSFDGVSLAKDSSRLAVLVSRGVDRGVVQAYRWFTNCATSALGFTAAACGTIEHAREIHPLLATESVNGTSPSWLETIAHDCGIAVPFVRGMLIKKGQLLVFAHGYHFEWALETVVVPSSGPCIIDHGGGGRANNAITLGRSDILSSTGHPLTDVYDVPSLLPLSPDLAPDELARILSPLPNAEGG